jgi:hypothetical protein
MKKTIILSLAIFIATITFAQTEKNEKYIGAMKVNIELIDMAFSKPEATNAFIELANNFERIANKEKTQWLPFYYAALCRVNYSYMQKDASGNDAIAEYATKLINKADSLMPNNSEISCIKSMIASMQMMVNPQQRWGQYGPISQKAMAAAMQQDPTNPRPYMLKGQGLKFTPEAFGGGCKTALEHLKTATEKFTTFKPASDIAPNWGKSYTETLVKECAGSK